MDKGILLATKTLVESIRHYIRDPSGVFSVCHARENTAVKRNAHVRDLRKRGKNKSKNTKECALNKNTKYKKTPENIR